MKANDAKYLVLFEISDISEEELNNAKYLACFH